jgi:uncharacterized protein YeaO (DUF488 family)
VIHIKRIYDEPSTNDGYRVLVDRLWPRGVSKERAALDMWLKDIAPSPELRLWFGHAPERFTSFSQKYLIELEHNPALPALLELVKKHSNVILLYAAKDSNINHAAVLKRFLVEHS